MKRLFVSLMFLGLLSVSPFVNAAAEPGNAGGDNRQNRPMEAKEVFDLNRLRQVDAIMKQAVATEALPSAVCFISYRGKPIFFEAYGQSNREERQTLRKDAIFRIASQTKLVTTVALMSMYQDGMFRLEDPVKKFLPEFAHPVVEVPSAGGRNMVTRPAKGDITIRELLCHSSGISYDSYGQDVEVIRYGTPVTTAEVVSRISKLPLKHDPGMGFTYGYSLDVAGRLAEVISGMRLDSLVKKRVLDPLEMTDTYFYLPKNRYKRLVPVYTKTDQSAAVVLADSLDLYYPVQQNPVYFGGGAGLSSTIEDYSHLCQMILDRGVYKNKVFLNKKIIEQMTMDQLFGVAGYYQFGLGLEIATDETFARTMKTPGSLRWGGYYGTEYFIDPTYNLVVQMYTNRVNWYRNEDVFGDILRAIYLSLKI